MTILRRFVKQEDGAIAIMMGLTVPLIFFLASIAIELSRQNYVETQLAFAVDAAAIAGARYDVNSITTNATRVFNANFPPGTHGISPVPTVVYDPNAQTVSVSVTSALPTVLGQILRTPTLPVRATSVVQREYGGLELAMVLDITGSMAQNDKIGGLRTAATSLVNIIYQGQLSRINTAIAIVPFVTIVNIGGNNTSWVSDPATAALFPASVPWAGCVMANSMAETGDEAFDTPPPGMRWPIYYTPSTVPNPDDCVARDNDWRMVAVAGAARTCPGAPPATGNILQVLTASVPSVGPNRSCGPPIMPLHNNSADLINYINTLSPTDGGGTMGNIGLVWGGRVLSEFWDGLWNVRQSNGVVINGEPIKAYTDSSNKKAIIMMTDGGSNWYDSPQPPSTGDPTSYGTAPNDRYVVGKLGSTSRANFTTKIDNKIARLCTALKARGIKLYTITFRVTDPVVNNLYRNCASTPADFAAASDNTQLVNVFNNIAVQLQQLRIIG